MDSSRVIRRIGLGFFVGAFFCVARSVATAQVGPLGIAIRGHVLDPLHHLLWRATADVTVDVSVRSQHLA